MGLVYGKKKENTIKTTTISDGQGRLLWSGANRTARAGCTTRPRCASRASPSNSGSARRRQPRPEGFRGLANEFPDQVSAPPTKPKDDAPLGEYYSWREMRRRQSSDRICVEHANAELRQ
ncbi:hypothetical protein [Streptomyces avermitilis]|uniref:hypothetical protein n=1 Tax=Streptomyces avermitilis TaxID=33903 RepID=UPI00372142CB